MTLTEHAKILLEAGCSIEQIRHELRIADCQPTCSAVEGALREALAWKADLDAWGAEQDRLMEADAGKRMA